jgi:hypothetical protein
MEDKKVKKIQNDLNNNRKFINNNDEKNYDKNKFLDDISESEDESNELNSNYGDRNSNKNKDINNNKNKDINSNKDRNKNKDKNEDSSDNEGEYELNDEFKNKVIAYVKADDKLREIQNSMKDLRKIKKDTEEAILRHLERLGENMINITGGKLRKNQYESKEALKKEFIKEALSDKIKDVVAVEDLLEKMESKRKLKINVSIKRTFERDDDVKPKGKGKKIEK